MHHLTVLIALAMLGCLPKPNPAPAADYGPQFQQNLSNLERMYPPCKQNVESEDAKLQGTDQSISDKARNDPQYPLITKRGDELRAQMVSTDQEKEETVAWARTVTTPSLADVQSLSSKVNDINQSCAQVMTGMSQLSIEYMQLRSRAP